MLYCKINYRSPYHPIMLVNLESIEEWANGDTATMKEIIKLFVENTPPTLNLLDKAISEKDWESITKYAHKLKSSYGIVIIGNSLQLIQGIEQMGRDQKDESRIREDFGKVQDQYSEAVTEFEAFNLQHP